MKVSWCDLGHSIALCYVDGGVLLECHRAGAVVCFVLQFGTCRVGVHGTGSAREQEVFEELAKLLDTHLSYYEEWQILINTPCVYIMRYVPQGDLAEGINGFRDAHIEVSKVQDWGRTSTTARKQKK